MIKGLEHLVFKEKDGTVQKHLHRSFNVHQYLTGRSKENRVFYGVSTLGRSQKSSGQGPEQPALADPA